MKAQQQARLRAGVAATTAAAQAAPLAATAKLTARQGVHSMRAWAAPRIEQSGQLFEKNVAPRVSAMLSSAARKVEPSRPRRRWPFFVAGLVALGAAAGAAAVGWRNSQAKSQQHQAGASEPAGTTTPAGESNAKVHTP